MELVQVYPLEELRTFEDDTYPKNPGQSRHYVRIIHWMGMTYSFPWKEGDTFEYYIDKRDGTLITVRDNPYMRYFLLYATYEGATDSVIHFSLDAYDQYVHDPEGPNYPALIQQFV